MSIGGLLNLEPKLESRFDPKTIAVLSVNGLREKVVVPEMIID